MSAAPAKAAACIALARLTWLQVLRSRSIWLALALAMIPGATALLTVQTAPDDAWQAVVLASISVLAIATPVFAAGVIADELSDETYTFLWSRPIPRWCIYAGKLGAVLPLVAAVVLGGLVVAWSPVSRHGSADSVALGRALAGLAAGALALSVAAASIGTCVRKHPVVAALVYFLLLDIPVGQIPFGLRHLSLTFHARTLAGAGATSGGSLIPSCVWLALLTAAWLGLGLWRVSRLEPAA